MLRTAVRTAGLLVGMLGLLASPASAPARPVAAEGVAQILHLPLLVRSDITRWRPYSPSSAWNTPIGLTPQYDSHSAEMVATIGRGISSDPNQYSFTVYFTDNTTPRWNVTCTPYKCDVITPTGFSSTSLLTGVPIPPNAKPSSGTDGHLIVIDMPTGTEYDFWQAAPTATGWTVSNGSVYNIFWDGMPAPRYGSRGAGVPYYAGLLRPWEILQGHVDHALVWGYPETSGRGCVFPATRTDGESTLPYSIPEGARLQLDPAATEADFDTWKLTTTGKIIARALQKYGMILVDTSGRPKLYVEDLLNNPYSTLQWTDAALNLTSSTIASIPYDRFKVLALPAGYWDPALGGPLHGKCYK